MYIIPKCLYYNTNILFYDIRLIDNIIYLITYQGKNFEPDVNELSVYCNGDKILIKNIKYDEPEPMSWIECYLEKEYNTYDIKLIYKFVEYEVRLEKKVSKIESDMCISTLFKDDYELIEIFTKYYKKQGVSKFYLYYNGDINKIFSKLYKNEDIVYKEWNYKYFNYESKYYPNVSHAQMTCMTLAKIEHSKFHNYIIMNDLDEFIYKKSMNLLDYFNTGVIIQSRRVFNNWAVIKHSSDKNLFIYHKKNFNYERGKLIYHRSFEGGYSIHRNKTHSGIKNFTHLDDLELNMFHIVSPEHPDRFFEYDEKEHNKCELLI
jgi:hypothetical protein